MAKRGNGEGTIRHLKSGKWVWIKMDGRKSDGTINYIRVHGDTRKELLANVDAYKQAQARVKANSTTFETYAETWFQGYKRNLRVSTCGSYQYTLRKLKDYWGATPIADIKPTDVLNMLSHFEDKGLSGSYLHKLRSMAYQIFAAAEADGLITKNPVHYIKFKVDGDIPDKDAFSLKEIKSLLTATTDDPKMQDWACIAISTGLRPQEVQALRGSDLAADGSYVNVEQAINMDGNTAVVGATKSKCSNRKVPVPDAIRPLVVKYAADNDHLIWSGSKSMAKPINPSTYRKRFAKLCKAAGVRQLTPHCCRHTYATQLLLHGVDMYTIKVLMGHSRRDVTEGYLHVSMDTLNETVQRLNDLFAEADAT